jgi:cytochrome P450
LDEALRTYISEPSADPHRLFRELREEDPVFRSSMGFWLLTRYEDVDALLRSDRTSNVPPDSSFKSVENPDRVSPAAQIMKAFMLHMDPPDHTRLRRLMGKAFTARSVQQQWRRTIEEAIDDLLGAVERNGAMDVVDDFAYAFALHVICEIIGIDRGEHSSFVKWSEDICQIGDLARPATEESLDIADAGALAMTSFFDRLIEERRAALRDDLVSAFITAEIERDALTADEITATCCLLLIGGHESTASLIANGMFHLLRSPDQLESLLENPDLFGNAVEETLRYEPPVRMPRARVALEGLVLGGKEIPPGELVFPCLAAAGRDPDVVEDPDRFDITRPAIRHIEFGFGSHFCLGAHLARLETALAWEAMFHRLPDLTLRSADVHWVGAPGFGHLGPVSLSWDRRQI